MQEATEPITLLIGPCNSLDSGVALGSRYLQHPNVRRLMLPTWPITPKNEPDSLYRLPRLDCS